MSKKNPSPINQPSNIKNPNNPKWGADSSNRISQGHPNPPPPLTGSPDPMVGEVLPLLQEVPESVKTTANAPRMRGSTQIDGLASRINNGAVVG